MVDCNCYNYYYLESYLGNYLDSLTFVVNSIDSAEDNSYYYYYYY
jgi:hypothetical protein